MTVDGIIFDFDGVLVDSEYVGNQQVADYLTTIGRPISTRQAMDEFMGLSGSAFTDAIERWLGMPLPANFAEAREAEDARVLREGIAAVAGAVDFIRNMPSQLPRAIASSSSPDWVRTHLDHLDLRHEFEPHIYSGKVHVTRGKPEPDLYFHAAAALSVAIERVVIIEDSPVGVTGAVASGAFVIGLAAGNHCFDGHADRLRSLGAHATAHSFEEVAALLAAIPTDVRS